jgi:hypothetical protein
MIVESEIDYEWIELIDNFYERVKKELKEFNIEFVLDESGTSGGIDLMNRNCLSEKWKDWSSTFISARDPLSILSLPNEKEQLIKELNSNSNNNKRFKYLNQLLIPIIPLYNNDKNEYDNIYQVKHINSLSTTEIKKILNELFTVKNEKALIENTKFLLDVQVINYGKFDLLNESKLIFNRPKRISLFITSA